MMESRCWFRYVLVALLAFGGETHGMTWKAGDSWHLAVESFIPQVGAQPDNMPVAIPAAKYDLHAVVLGSQSVAGVPCWKLDFIFPGKTPPGNMLPRYRVLVDAKDGWPRKAFNLRDYKNAPIAQVGAVRALSSPPEGYPVDLIPVGAALKAEVKENHLLLSLSGQDKSGVRRMTLQTGDGQQIEVRQTWKEGEKWWREYERYRNGHLELRARLILKPEGQPEAATVPAKNAAAGKQLPKGTPAPEPPDPLREDRRLQVKISMDLRSPVIPELLDRLGRATDLTFDTDVNVDPKAQVFSSATWANMPVWKVMKQIADSPAIQGRWEKTEQGYRLLGKPGSATLPTTPTSNYRWLLVTCLVVQVAVVTGLFIRLWRRRVNQTPPAGNVV